MSVYQLDRLHRLTVSLAQMDCRPGEPEGNEERAAAFIEEAARRGSDLVLLPELWRCGYDLANAPEYAAPLGSGSFVWVAAQARAHRLWIAGSLLETRSGQICNTATLYSPDGDLAAVYRKVHLFRLMDEHLYLAAGDRAPVFDLPWGRSAMGICYDLRFPELLRHYALEGAVLVLLPAQWPRRRVDALRVLLRARAAENQCFMMACNRVGRNGDTPFAGHSAMVDPWGNLIVEGGETELLLTADLDLSMVADVRQQFPSFQDRRPDVYDTSR